MMKTMTKPSNCSRSLRSDYPNKEEICVYLSNAYAGLTGIDTFNLLETISDLDDTDDEGSIDMIGLLLGDAEGVINQPAVDSKMDLLALAQAAIDTCIDSPGTDERVQVGLLGLGDAALIIANLVLADLDLDPVRADRGRSRVPCMTAFPISTSTTTSPTKILRGLTTAWIDIADAVDALEEMLGADEENDLSESFNEFLMDLDPAGDGVDRNDIAQLPR